MPTPVEAVANSVPEKSVPVSVDAPAELLVQAPGKSVQEPSESSAAVESKGESQPESAVADSSVQNLNVSDSTKAEQNENKKFSISPLKKVGPIRLVKGFRSSQLRPRISLDSQKEVADSVRQWMYERRNKYEKFVDNVLGKASPIGAKQPAPGADSSANDAVPSGGAIGVATPSPVSSIPLEAQRDPSGK